MHVANLESVVREFVELVMHCGKSHLSFCVVGIRLSPTVIKLYCVGAQMLSADSDPVRTYHLHVTRTCEGEDGTIRGWTADRGKLCGSRKFTAHSEPSPDVDDVQHDTGEGSNAGVEALDRSKLAGVERGSEEVTSATNKKGEIPIPVCALVSCRLQPLIAVGLCHGAVHIMFVKQVSDFLRVARHT